MCPEDVALYDIYIYMHVHDQNGPKFILALLAKWLISR